MARLAGTVLAATVLAAACGGGDDEGDGAANGETAADRRADPASRDSEDSEDSGTTTSAVDPFEREQAAVEDAYRAAMEARIDSAAGSAVDPDFPALAETHVDPMLDEWTSQLERWAFSDHVVRYSESPEITVLSVTFGWDTSEDGSGGAGDAGPDDVGDLATVQACIVDGGELVHQPTGKVEPNDRSDDSGLVSVYEHATLKKVDGAWKLAERRPDNDWPGRAGCAVD